MPCSEWPADDEVPDGVVVGVWVTTTKVVEPLMTDSTLVVTGVLVVELVELGVVELTNGILSIDKRKKINNVLREKCYVSDFKVRIVERRRNRNDVSTLSSNSVACGPNVHSKVPTDIYILTNRTI